MSTPVDIIQQILVQKTTSAGGISTGFVPVSEVIPQYLGFVGTRGKSPDAVAGGGNVQCMSRSKHVAMENISALALAFAAWYANNGVETGAGGAGTFTASIEYPIGTTPSRITFSGKTSGAVANGATLISDLTPLTTPIPKGAAFYVRIWQAFSAGGFVYANTPGLNIGTTPPSGEWVNYGTSVADLTGVTTNVNSNLSGNSLGSVVPFAILGYTTRPCILITGDSRNQANLTAGSELMANAEGATGESARSIIKSFAYCNVACGGEQAQQAAAGSLVQRALMAKYCSHIVCNYGINDFNNSQTAAQVLANIITFVGLLGNKPTILSTVSPQTSSTDGWGTTANQTLVNSAANTQRITYNDTLRRGNYNAPIAGFADVAAQVESAVGSGLWTAAQRSATDFAITSGLPTLTSAAGAKFVPDDVGKTVAIAGAGASGGVLVSAILGYTSPTSVTLYSNASTTVSAATGYIGTYTQEGLHGSVSAVQAIENSSAWAVLQSLK